MSYFRVFLIRLPDLTTLMTRQVMSAAVNAHTTITTLFRVGRCVMTDEILDPTVASVTLRAGASRLPVDDVELSCVADEGVTRGSPLTRQSAAAIKVKIALFVTMMLEQGRKEENAPVRFPPTPRRQLSHYTRSAYQCQFLHLTQ